MKGIDHWMRLSRLHLPLESLHTWSAPDSMMYVFRLCDAHTQRSQTLDEGVIMQEDMKMNEVPNTAHLLF